MVTDKNLYSQIKTSKTIIKKIIFQKDWIQLQPYDVADITDQYYTNIANQIFEILITTGYDKEFDKKDDVKHLALCLAAYFEDVISQTNIWETFTEECKRRYGKFIPQYRIMDEQVLNLK